MTPALQFKQPEVRLLLAKAEKEPDPKRAIDLRILADKIRRGESRADGSR